MPDLGSNEPVWPFNISTEEDEKLAEMAEHDLRRQIELMDGIKNVESLLELPDPEEGSGMPDRESGQSRPSFRELVVYEGLPNYEETARRMFEWLVEVDRPAAAGHARYLRMLQARGLNRDQVLVMSYTRLFTSMDKYSARDARWGWEEVDARRIRPATRLGFWPLPNYRQPAPPRHPEFRELVIYEGPFDYAAVVRRLLAWLVEVDRPKVVAQAPRFRDLLSQARGQNDLVGTMYQMLYDLLFPYCGPDATWGWETAEPERTVPVARFGFWPLQDGRGPTGEKDPNRFERSLREFARVSKHGEKARRGEVGFGFPIEGFSIQGFDIDLPDEG